jgi:hypothetical protein
MVVAGSYKTRKNLMALLDGNHQLQNGNSTERALTGN